MPKCAPECGAYTNGRARAGHAVGGVLRAPLARGKQGDLPHRSLRRQDDGHLQGLGARCLCVELRVLVYDDHVFFVTNRPVHDELLPLSEKKHMIWLQSVLPDVFLFLQPRSLPERTVARPYKWRASNLSA